MFLAVPPKILPFTFGDLPLNEGQLITVPCAVIEGDSPISLKWLFNDQSIPIHMRVTVVPLGERNMILSVGSVQAIHAGQYTCAAHNDAGTYEFTANMTVNGKDMQGIGALDISNFMHDPLCPTLISFIIL